MPAGEDSSGRFTDTASERSSEDSEGSGSDSSGSSDGDGDGDSDGDTDGDADTDGDGDGDVDDLQDNTLVVDAIVTADAFPLNNPYTYSDMTGQQLMLASNDPGYYRQLFTCEGSSRQWYDLTWDVDLPSGTHVVFSVRNADTQQEPAEAEWIPFASVTADNQQGARDLGSLINSIGGQYLELEVTLYMDNPEFNDKGCEPVEAASPRVKSIAITSECTNIVVVV